ncbi:MAG: hypothetical protein MZV70_11485 [Desulfobacterales bacterium]|nr:hypothetical protein [Desulfobacterales bacterium]
MKKAQMESFQRAISKIPDNLQEFIDIAKIFKDKEMNDYAIKTLEDGIKTHPGNLSLYALLFNLYEQTNSSAGI